MKYTPEKPRQTLDPGIYQAKITNAEEGFSQKGDEILELAFDVQDERGHSMKISDRLYNTEKARWRISVVRHAFGFDDPFGVETEFLPSAMIGKTAWVEIKLGDERPNGKRYLEVAQYAAKRDGIKVSEVPTDNVPF
jgi:hypothetical protein